MVSTKLEDLSIFYSFVEGFFKGPRYCSLGFFIDPREKGGRGKFGPWKGDDETNTKVIGHTVQ